MLQCLTCSTPDDREAEPAASRSSHSRTAPSHPGRAQAGRGRDVSRSRASRYAPGSGAALRPSAGARRGRSGPPSVRVRARASAGRTARAPRPLRPCRTGAGAAATAACRADARTHRRTRRPSRSRRPERGHAGAATPGRCVAGGFAGLPDGAGRRRASSEDAARPRRAARRGARPRRRPRGTCALPSARRIGSPPFRVSSIRDPSLPRSRRRSSPTPSGRRYGCWLRSRSRAPAAVASSNRASARSRARSMAVQLHFERDVEGPVAVEAEVRQRLRILWRSRDAAIVEQRERRHPR